MDVNICEYTIRLGLRRLKINRYKVLAFGSNVGNRFQHIQKATNLLEENGVSVVRESSLYITEPVDCIDDDWFLNQVVCISTSVTVEECHSLCKDVEKKMGRIDSYRNAPRPIDIDLILWEDLVFETKELSVPHPRIHGRKFVLVPLLEVIPDPYLLVWLVQNIHGQTIHKVTDKKGENIE